MKIKKQKVNIAVFIDFYSTMKKDKTNKLILFTSPKKKKKPAHAYFGRPYFF